MTYDITAALSRAPARAQEPLYSVGVSTPDKVDDTQPPSLPGSGRILPPDAEQAPVKRDDLDSVIKHLNEYVQSVRRDVQFSIDEDSGRTIIKVLDSETKEVIRQFPPEEVISISHNLARGNGMIFHAKA